MWILSPGWDWLLFIGSPLVVAALFVPLIGRVRSEQLSLFLLAFFTFGHHLPGFLRAYGDRDLFARYKWRFLLAPPLVFAATLASDTHGLHGLLLLVFLWDIWHVLMQHYGFMRIYDAKMGVTDSKTARLDWGVSLSWYVTAIAWSPHYVHDLFYRVFSSGVPVVPAGLVKAVTWGLAALSVLVTVLYVAHQWRRRMNLRKLATLAAFLFASWYLYAGIRDFVAGFAIWSAFHCLQYFGIVWAYNRNRREREGALAGWAEAMFAPRPLWVACYAAVILAYGAVNYSTQWIADETARRWLMSFVITSGALHYYYDAFIWKIREPETARWLKLPAAAGIMRNPGLAQASVFTAALIALALLEMRHPGQEMEIRRALARIAQGAEVAHLNLGDALREAKMPGQALEAYQEAARRGGSAEAHHKLGLALAALDRPAEALAEFERAAALDAAHVEAHYNAALLLARRGEPDRALRHLASAFPGADSVGQASKQPDAAGLLNNLGLGKLRAGRRDEARALFERAANLAPKDAGIRVNLGSLYMMERRWSQAEGEFRAAVAADPRHAMAHNNLGLLLIETGRREQARPHLEFAGRHGDEAVRRRAIRALDVVTAER